MFVVGVDVLEHTVDNKYQEVKLANPNDIDHRDRRRRRVCRDKCWNPGDPYTPSRIEVLEIQAQNARIPK